MAEPTNTPDKNTASPEPGPLTARRLRQLAEKASGLRDEELVLVYVDETVGWDLVPKTDASSKPGPKVPVNSPPVQAGATANTAWGRVDDVIAKFDGQEMSLVREGCDALFWSPAAIEKFVLAYYLPILTYDDWMPLYLRLNGRLKGGTPVYAIAHTYPSVSIAITNDSGTKFLTPMGAIDSVEFIEQSKSLFQEQFAALL